MAKKKGISPKKQAAKGRRKPLVRKTGFNGVNGDAKDDVGSSVDAEDLEFFQDPSINFSFLRNLDER